MTNYEIRKLFEIVTSSFQNINHHTIFAHNMIIFFQIKKSIKGTNHTTEFKPFLSVASTEVYCPNLNKLNY